MRSTWGLIAAAIAVRLAFILTHRIDSDEPQHLHVAWAWSRGLVQYRDVFDNHFPLLHLVFAPLMSLVPESSAVLLIARLAIAPVALACAWLLYRLALPLVGGHAAAIAAITFSVLPPWLPTSVEFRNDTLWIFFWLAALVLVAARRPWLAGAAAALCLLASVKAAPLLFAHVLALGLQQQPVRARSVLRFAAGAAIPLFAAALFFYARGAFDEMLYGTLLFNVSLPVDPWRRIGGALAFAAIVPAIALRGASGIRDRDPLAVHLLWFAFWYALVLLCFWPSLGPRDFLPLVPLGALAFATTRISPAILVLAATVASAYSVSLWQPADPSRHRFIDDAVSLTTRDEYVFDIKGNAVFRRRPVYTIYDIVGRALTNNGTIPDRGPEHIIARRCCVAIADASHIPPRTRTFLQTHFVDFGALRVCGAVVRGNTFTIAVPHTYALIARQPWRVAIDGEPYRGPRFLAAGRHTLTSSEETVTVIWWRAAERVEPRGQLARLP